MSTELTDAEREAALHAAGSWCAADLTAAVARIKADAYAAAAAEVRARVLEWGKDFLGCNSATCDCLDAVSLRAALDGDA